MTITSTRLQNNEFSASVSVGPDHDRSTITADLRAELEQLGDRDAPVQIWVEDAQPGDNALLADLARPYRDLLQLRRSLPAPPSGLTTRAFVPATDADAFFAVNNRAFSWHPEQSGFDQARLDEAMAESWFNADGFRILELEGRMAGFCWTKLHVELSPVVGEIYVIAIDPDFHGRGLGGPMTLAGLEWISAQGVTVANLYVEADNAPALATYDRLGFATYSVNRAFTTAPQPH